MPHPPVEAVYAVHHGSFRCNGKEGAIQMANDTAQYVKELDCDGLCMIVFSRIEPHPKRDILHVNRQNHKELTPPYTIVPWHIHILVLSIPGKSIADQIHRYLMTEYPCHGTLGYIEKCDSEHERNAINYILKQSIIIRTVAMGDPYRLAHREEFLRMIDDTARAIGYQWLAITHDYIEEK